MNCDRVFQVLTQGPFPTGRPIDRLVEEHLEHCRSCCRLAAALQPSLEVTAEAVGPEEGCDLPTYWGAIFSSSAQNRESNSLLEMDDNAAPATQAGSAMGLQSRNALGSHLPWRNLLRFLASASFGVIVAYSVAAKLQRPDASASAMRSVFPDSRLSLVAAGASRQPPVAPPVETVDQLQPEQARLLAIVRLQLVDACRKARTLSTDVAVPAQHPVPGEPRLAADSTRQLLAGMLEEVSQQQCCTACHHAGSTHAPQLRSAAIGRLEQSCHICHE